MDKAFGLFMLLWFVAMQGNSQDCAITLRGRIMDENSVDALSDALVVVTETQQSVYTDALGRFQLNGLCKGKTTIAVSHIGCETQLVMLYLQRDTTLKIKLNHKEHELSEVTVQEARTESHSTQSTIEIESMQLEKLRGLSLGETMKKIPGLYTLNTGATISKPVIHGLYGNRVVIMNNGVRLESQQWGSEHAPEIDPYIAKKITIVKGAGSLRYGSDAIGGVILVDPDPLPEKHGTAGELNFAAFSNNAEMIASATLEGCYHRVPALSWRVQGTFRRGGNSQTAEYGLGNTGIYEGNFSTALGWKKSRYGVEVFFSRFQTQIGILSAAHIGNLTDLQQSIERGKPLEDAPFTYQIGRPKQRVIHQFAKARAYYQSPKAGDFSLTLAWQDNERSEFDVLKVYVADTERPSFFFQIQTVSADAVWSHRTVKNVSGSLGIQMITQTNNFRYAYFIPDFRNVGTGIYAIERWIKGNIEVEGGLRFDYRWNEYFVRNTNYRFDTILHFFAPSGNIGFEYHPKENFDWRMNFGTAFRAPSANELFADGVHHGAATYEIGNRTMKPEQSFNLSTSFTYEHRFVRLDMELFSNYILNYINLVPSQPATLTIRGAYPTFRYVQQNALLTGSDVQLTLRPQKGLEFFNKTSLLFARNTDRHDWLEQMPPLRMENGVRYTALINKKVKEVYAGASVWNVFKQNQVPKELNEYAPPPSAYWLLNFEAGVLFNFGHHQFTVGMNVENVANVMYRDYLDRFRYYAGARGINAALRLSYHFFAPEHKH